MTSRGRIRRTFFLCLIVELAVVYGAWPREGAAQPSSPAQTEVVKIRVGFDGHFKVGFWTPVEVTLAGGTESWTGIIDLLVPDGDGVLSRVTTLPERGVRTTPDRHSTALLYAKFGRSEGELTVRFVAEGKIRAQRIFRSGIAQDERHIAYALPSQDELVLTVGPSVGIAAAIARPPRENQPQIHVVNLPDVSQLPTRWYGYDGIDTVVLTTSDSATFRRLSPGGTQIEALQEWVELGGQLVLFVASEAAEVLADGSALAELVPGKFDRMVPLTQVRALETYSESDSPIETRGASRLDVPRFRDVSGNIEAYEGNRPRDLPLVIRAPRAFGEVVLIAVDLDRPPFRDWPGRSKFVQRILQKGAPALEEDDQWQSRVWSLGYNDLVGQLRSALEKNFVDIQPVSFAVVAGLVLFYILMIGPVDYFLVKKIFKRMELTWVSFPIWVILFSVGAYVLANWLKGDKLRINQAEVVDVDMASGRVRGTTWTHLFSPRPDSYNLSVRPLLPDNAQPDNSKVLISWLGLPGTGLGGMQSGAASPSLFTRAYSYTPDLDRMAAVPIQVWSTKSFTSRWTSLDDRVSMEAKLAEDADHMLAGTIVNHLGIDLSDAVLLYDRWAYQVPSLADGESLTLDDTQAPQTISTWLKQKNYSPSSTDVRLILNMMMFHDAVGGKQITQILNRYQSFCDLSGHLKLGRAILLVHGQQLGSQLLRDGQSMAGPFDRQWTVYRFVFPVERTVSK